MTAASVAMIAGAYLLGSIPTGLMVARARGVDIRAVGSGNIGATNVARSLGRRLGVLVLIIDALKGLTPVMAARFLHLGESTMAAVGLAAIVGHVFPVWLKFRGGKGVATALGVFAGLSPLPAAAGVLVYLVAVLVTRISSVGSLLGATGLLGAMVAFKEPPPTLLLGAAVWALILIRHRSNIRRLLRREETKV